MNDEELQNKIKTSIKNEKLRKYLLECLKNECEINSLNLPSFLIEKAAQRFKDKIKACQQIEIDLPDNLIPSSDSYIILPKLETLRLKLAMLYADSFGSEITEERSSYTGIKDFIFNILSISFNLKLKYFDLTIKLLEKAEADKAKSYFNREVIGALDLLKKFVTEEKYIPNEADLKYISDLGRESNEVGIRKCFYGIIRELNKKLLFQDLLEQLLKIVKNQNNSPLIQFNIIFITNCLNDVTMEAADFNQIIGLVYRALEQHNRISLQKFHAVFKRVLNQKNLNDHLIKYEENFKEKTSGQIINDTIRYDLTDNEKNTVENNTQELDLTIYFPTHINNEKIRDKFTESQHCSNEALEKNITHNDVGLKNKWFGLIGSKLHELKTNVKTKATDVKENLMEFVEKKTDEIKGFRRENSETLNQEENSKTDEMNLNASVIQAKEKLLSIKEKLDSWNLILHISNAQHHNYSNQINASQVNITQCLMLNEVDDSTNQEYKTLIQQIVTEFEKINTAIKEKNKWFSKPELGKSSLFHKIFRCGYFNSNFTNEKIKSHLGVRPNFLEINNFILKQGFWRLLSYGIVRWPWMNKNIFADTWAEQFCLPEIINQTNNLKNNHAAEDVLKKIISLAEDFFLIKKAKLLFSFWMILKNI